MLKEEKTKSADNSPPLKIKLKSVDETSQFAEIILNTWRGPLMVLDHDLKVITASSSFYDFFKITSGVTIGKFIYELGNQQWNIPKLKELLETILPEKLTDYNYEVEKLCSEKSRTTDEYLEFFLNHAHAPTLISDSSFIRTHINPEFKRTQRPKEVQLF